MKRVEIIFLVLTGLSVQGCSSEAAQRQVETKNSQEISRSNLRQENTENNAKPAIQKKQPDEQPDVNSLADQSDKNSIKDTKGLIVLNNKYGKKDFIRFYNEDNSLWYKFSFYYDDSDGKFDYENEDFLPFAFHPDYFILALKCVSEDKVRYEVIVNEETGLKKYVKKDDPTLKFETWEEHIKGAFAISYKQEKNPLRETPEGKIINVDLPAEITFHPVKIKGDWLKIRWSTSKKTKNDVDSGWIKWRENNNLLIELFHSS